MVSSLWSVAFMQHYFMIVEPMKVKMEEKPLDYFEFLLDEILVTDVDNCETIP